MNKHRIAVPPGVGDVYWCLTKLQAYRELHGVDHVELCVQRAGPGRSTMWSDMVDFVDSSSFLPFSPSQALKNNANGFVQPGPSGTDCLMWPNTVVDRGEPLANWLPDLDMDLNFNVRTKPMGDPRVIVYASSEAINRAWMSNLGGTAYWLTLIETMTALVGPVTLIAAQWDAPFSVKLAAAAAAAGVDYEDLTGQTTLPEVADILQNACIVVGVISGMTILANHFRTPTIALYPTAHHPDFPRTWVAQDAPYLPICATDAPAAQELALLAQGIFRSSP